MTTSRRWICILSAALAVAGCSSHGPTPKPAASSVRPTASPTSAFCLDLTPFQVAVVVFRGGVVDAVRGKQLDLKDMRRKAAIIGHMGSEMRASAPPDIAKQFTAVLKAVKTSARHLKPGAKVREVVLPMYDKDITPAFDAVDKYRCH